MKKEQTLAALSNEQLIRKGDRAVWNRHELAIEILDCLIEIERRSLYLKEGYSSLFEYCTRRWHYSSPKAGRTIAVARCAKKFPGVRSLLVERKIKVCGVARIAGILTEKNSDELLREVSGKKYVEIDRIAASRRTAPAIREFVRPIGMKSLPSGNKSAGNNDLFQPTEEMAAGMAGRTANRSRIDTRWQIDRAASNGVGQAPRPNSGVEKTENRYEIRFSASEGFLRKLLRAQAICSRRPGLESVLEKALDELLDRHDPERRVARREKRKSVRRALEENASSGATISQVSDEGDPPGPDHARIYTEKGRTKPRSRHIPTGIRDAVFTRDAGRCTYVSKNGIRCGATAHLQIDHIRPFCLGGEHTLDNLRLLCGKHNRLVARELSRST